MSDMPEKTLLDMVRAETKYKDDTQMEFTTFVRKPFLVEAVEITAENIEEVAKFVGDLRQKEDGTPFILVDRRLVPNVYRVYPGFFMTKMGENVRCYSRKIFREQFIEKDKAPEFTADFFGNEANTVVTTENQVSTDA